MFRNTLSTLCSLFAFLLDFGLSALCIVVALPFFSSSVSFQVLPCLSIWIVRFCIVPFTQPPSRPSLLDTLLSRLPSGRKTQSVKAKQEWIFRIDERKERRGKEELYRPAPTASIQATAARHPTFPIAVR